jgi:hypothetical protein
MSVRTLQVVLRSVAVMAVTLTDWTDSRLIGR